MCMYVQKIDLCVEILLEWTSVRPSPFREGLGGSLFRPDMGLNGL